MKSNYKITDLTMREGETSEGEYYPICSMCETSMTRGNDGYFCLGCGLVEDAGATFKSREKTGPKIVGNNNNKGIIFKNIQYSQTSPRNKSQLQELFDAEDELEENRLKAQGCLIGDEISFNNRPNTRKRFGVKS